MGVQGTFGRDRTAVGPFERGWVHPMAFDEALDGLQQKATSWSACPDAQSDTLRNRQFLANLALDLVQIFLVEERHLRRAHSRLLADRRRQNHGLAQELRDLMRRADQGLDIAEGIRQFLSDWRQHQEQSPLVNPAPGIAGH